MTGLELLSLHHNDLSGGFPSFWGANMNQLVDLWMHHNQLSGNLPAGIADMANLARLYLDENNLQGTVPSSLGQMQKLGKKSYLCSSYLKDLYTTNQVDLHELVRPTSSQTALVWQSSGRFDAI